MKTKIIATLKVLFFLGLGILLIWVITKNLTEEQKQQVYQSLQNANYGWVVLAVFFGIISNISRAVRWNMLLKTMGHTPKRINSFFAVSVGYLANLAVPRLGEVSRCGILTRYENIPFNQSFGTVITERIIDIVILLLLFVTTFLLEYEKIYGYTFEKIILPLKNKLAGSGLAFYILVFIFVLLIVAFFFILKKKSSGNSILTKTKGIAMGFWEGIKSIKNVEKPILFIMHSLTIWLMYYLSVYVCFLCFEETSNLSAAAALVVLTFGSVAVIVTPGGIGAYPAIVTEVLSLFSIATPIGFAFGWIVWLSQAGQIIIIGLISLLLLPLLNKTKGIN